MSRALPPYDTCVMCDALLNRQVQGYSVIKTSSPLPLGRFRSVGVKHGPCVHRCPPEALVMMKGAYSLSPTI